MTLKYESRVHPEGSGQAGTNLKIRPVNPGFMLYYLRTQPLNFPLSSSFPEKQLRYLRDILCKQYP